MLNHIVMWKIKEDVTDKEKVKLGIKNGLEGLFGKIEELKEIKVERKMSNTLVSRRSRLLDTKSIFSWRYTGTKKNQKKYRWCGSCSQKRISAHIGRKRKNGRGRK